MLLNSLTHTVKVEGNRFAIGTYMAEDLKGLVLGCGREGKETDIGLSTPLCHGAEDFLLIVW